MFRYDFIPRFLLPVCALLVIAVPPRASTAGQSAIDKIKERGVLLWGCDAEGGAPMAFPDPKDPSKLIGFEVDIVEAIAKQLGVKAQLIQTAWDSLIPALERGDYDMAMNGIEIIPEREKRVLFSRPYYVYTLQLMVRKDDDRIKSIRDLSGKKVGTLAGAVAHDMLTKIGGVDIRSYSAAWPYEDLALGRLDAVFLDTPIAAYYGRPDPRLKYAGPPEGGGFYGIALRKEEVDLKDSSIVSVIAMVELTKTYAILAATTLRYFELGLVVAILYFGMSYPLSIVARRVERRMKGAK
jgi:polar amino acid transport system substrate-binding protein